MCQTPDQYTSNSPPTSVIQWHRDGSLTHAVPEEMLHGQYAHLPLQKGLKGSHPTGEGQHKKSHVTPKVCEEWTIDSKNAREEETKAEPETTEKGEQYKASFGQCGVAVSF